MKHFLAFIAGILAASSMTELPKLTPSDIALEAIAEVLKGLSPTTLTEHSLELTASEKKAVGRYFETPQLEEIYPGIGRALAREGS